MSAWIKCSDRLPEDGQQVVYFGMLGMWIGVYTYSPASIPGVSPHVFSSKVGCCDTDEVSHWRPYDPLSPSSPLPPDYVAMVALLRDGAALDEVGRPHLLGDRVTRYADKCQQILEGHREFV